MAAHPTIPRLRKLLVWLPGTVIGIVVLLTAAVLIAERLIDTPKVRAQLASKLSTLMNGQVTWQSLEVRLLPMPHGVVRNAHIAIPKVVTVDVATADVKIRLLPLLHGNAEVQAITLERPSVDVWISPPATDAAAKSSTPVDPLALYRNAMRPVLDAIARFAPATTVAIEDGRVALHLFDLPPFEASKLDLQIVTDDKGVAVDASATGTYWDRIAIGGRVEFADLSASVKLDAAGLKPQPALENMFTSLRESLLLSNVDMKLEARTDGHTGFDVALGLNLPKAVLQRRGQHLDIVQVQLAGSIKFLEDTIAIALDKAQIGELIPAAAANLLLSGAKRAPKLDVAIDELDLSRLRDAAMALAGDQPAVKQYIARIHGGRLRDLRLSTQAEVFAELFSLPRLHGSAQLADASMRIPVLEREATRITANAELSGGTIKVSNASARLGASQLRRAGVNIVLAKPMRMAGTRGQASIVLHDLLPGLRTREPFTRLLRPVPTLTGVAETNVRNLALRFDKPGQVVYDLSVIPQHIRINSDKLPGPADVHGGTVRITSKSINAGRIGIAVLDSKATVSGELSGFQGGDLRVTARVADGFAEQKLIDWIWLRAAIAERLKPVPLRFTAQQVQWSKAGLDILAEANINAGPSLSIDLSTRDKAFTLRRATIKDRDSDANISFAMRDALAEVGFTGVLAARSLAPILGRPAENYPGIVSGDIQVAFDLQRQGRNTARGNLTGERVDLRNLTGKPLKLERFDMQGNGNALQIRELTMDWAQQKATIHGAVTRDANELAMNLDIDSPGIVIDALRGAPAPKATGVASGSKTAPGKPFDLWSLPVRGAVSLRTDFLEYRGYRVQGIRADAKLQHELATVNLSEASLCGITFPLSLRVTPDVFDASVNVTAKDQSIERAAQCLAGREVIITGNFNLSSALTTRGPTQRIGESLAEHLAGSVEFSTRNGVIRKMTLLSSILSLKSVRDLNKSDATLGPDGFKYQSIVVDARIDDGRLTFEQAALDSSALGLAATGTINLQDFDSRLSVLVAPFGTLDRIARKIPIVGYVIGGAFTSIPISITGDIRKPIVVPLGPQAVGSEVLGIFERTFKLPGKMVEPLSTKPDK